MKPKKQKTKTLKISEDVHTDLKHHVVDIKESMTEFADAAIRAKLPKKKEKK